MVYISCNMGTCGLPDKPYDANSYHDSATVPGQTLASYPVNTSLPEVGTCSPRTKGVYIRQTTLAYVTTVMVDCKKKLT